MLLNQTIESLFSDKGEADVYMASLRLGEALLSDIAKKAGVPRTSCYHILDALIKKGFINYYQKRGRKYYTAGSPRKFEIVLKEREAALKQIFPQLMAMHSAAGAAPAVSYFDGPSGVKTILNNILEEQRPLLALTSIDDMVSVIGEDFYDFIRARKNKFLHVKLLTSKTPSSLILKKKDAQELRETRFIGSEVKLKTANFIYSDHVAIVSLNPGKPMGIILEDRAIADTQRFLFEALWTHSQEG